ncbi:biotin--[acetyl-CoA-carboxylase] ligase [Flavobacterium capsici]|uniref:Biotin--[acetyl-CoA-carboxylase] ligase n=1 Tax=Flavobacterium capsici TaxID=3075618 RepID=A0AA96EZS9_9FLAO|nr:MULTISPECIES: biotin--[acetyl-CoA-carboxylase] ligase [unclassified Flavobacterium]WNM18716.1 biotin--[acetyl-CoA-carboxylase] ligase [Flavobacterium sp. PMR2A8]WNM22767.1 biotin--[acetyl-CoA-carboxylase] ligase [Flavobacterium sp. PMTSA4]
MLVIKLNAIDSTNDYLKQLNKEKTLSDYTVVTTFSQTKGKGQMGSNWISEPGKNLTFSVLVKDSVTLQSSIFDCNVAVAVSVLEVLQSLKIPNLNIKWPNDILAESKKIGGILIENSIKADGMIDTVIGIGLNINQEDFSGLPSASSLKNIVEKDFDLEFLLEKIVNQLKSNLNKLPLRKEFFWEKYKSHLFKINQPMAFEDLNQNRFMGIITGVSSDGKLELVLEDDSCQTFGLKEIRMLY